MIIFCLKEDLNDANFIFSKEDNKVYEIQAKVFNDGTKSFFTEQNFENKTEIILYFKFKKPFDLYAFYLLNLLDYLSKQFVLKTIIVPFFPYLRKNHNFSSCLSFFDNFNFVTIDSHSNFPNFQSMHFKLNVPENYLIIYPDKGSFERISSFYSNEYIVLQKKRSDIIEFSCSEAFKIKNRKCLIVDDICDSGDTLQAALKYVKNFNPEKTEVYITHFLYEKELSSFQGLDCLYFCDTIFRDIHFSKLEGKYNLLDCRNLFKNL